MNNNIPTYVLHYDKLTERKAYLEKELEHQKFTNVQWYSEYPVEDFDKIDMSKYYRGCRPEIYTRKVIKGGWENPWIYRPTPLRPAEISLTIKFGKIFEIIGYGNHHMSLIFEDDVILQQNFIEKFNSYLERTPDDWDVIYMGSGCNLKPKNIKPDQVSYKVPHPASRCADSILIKKNAACALAKIFFPFDMCSDWELGYLQSVLNLNVYWWEPSLVKQGSENGVYKSSLR